jgi:hypothetical protein
MAMMRIPPMPVQVGCDRFSGRPRSIRLAAGSLPVLSISRIRDESKAYPAGTGPRTRFEVETPGARFCLTYEHRGRRWSVDGLDPEERAIAA